MQRILVSEFIAQKDKYNIFDVRSPGEFKHAHIPMAVNLPLFSDQERADVGTIYKQKSKQEAILKGLEYFGPKVVSMVTEASANIDRDKEILVHCWRGGMRSEAVSWLLNLYGFKVSVLEGGYKSFRQFVLSQFDLKYDFKVLGGYTGSGKTKKLLKLKSQGYIVIDLEGLAAHRGSTFGALGQKPQPSQEMFENTLAGILYELKEKAILIEDEGIWLGRVMIPKKIHQQMQAANLLFLDIKFEDRLDEVTKEYGQFGYEQLSEGVARIREKLGGLVTKQILEAFQSNDMNTGMAKLLLYYDRKYLKSTEKTIQSGRKVVHGNMELLSEFLEQQ